MMPIASRPLRIWLAPLQLPGYDLEHARASLAESGIRFLVHYLEVPALAISSSDLRSRVAAGQSLRYLTSDSVRRLYQKSATCMTRREHRTWHLMPWVSWVA